MYELLKIYTQMCIYMYVTLTAGGGLAASAGVLSPFFGTAYVNPVYK